MSLGDRLYQLICINIEASALAQWDPTESFSGTMIARQEKQFKHMGHMCQTKLSSSSAQVSDSDSHANDTLFTLKNWEDWLQPSD